MTLGKLTLFERKVIGAPTNPLMIRYVLIRIPAFGIYIHNMRRSDYDRALHDHPWPFVSVVLKGGYNEYYDPMPGEERGRVLKDWRGPGSILRRPAEWKHRFELDREWWTPDSKGPEIPAWTLVFVGRRSRLWGFWLENGWCWWRKHNDQLNICEDQIQHYGGRD